MKLTSLAMVLLFLSVSCGSRKNPAKRVDATPVWFKTEKRFSIEDSSGNPMVHPFFDLAPFGSGKDNSVNFFVTTPRGSHHYYDIDLVSGRLYRRRSYCEQVDIWEKYSEDIHRPKFNIGLVPRLLDQLGNPQKIVIFGKQKYFHKFKKNVTYSQRAKVIGGVIHQFCQRHPCKTRDNWLSTLVLIGINAEDPRYSNITNLTQLKKKINWNYFKAFMENGFGRTKNGPFEAPAYRMVGEVPGKEALKFALNKGHLFKFEEMRRLRSSCEKLYDYLWEGSKVVRKLAKEQQQLDKKNKKKNDYLFVIENKYKDKKGKVTVNRFEEQEIIKVNQSKVEQDFKLNKRKYSDFSKFFFDFHLKYAPRYKTCMKFVKPSSLSENAQRHWFFAFVNGFMKLEQSDYIYRCNKRGWVENSKLSSGKRIFDVNARRKCSAFSLDYAFDQVVTVNTGLKRAARPHHRFLEYDYGVGGSHQKIQSWVYDDGKVISCAESEDREARKKWSEKNPQLIFPLDLQWRRFTVE